MGFGALVRANRRDARTSPVRVASRSPCSSSPRSRSPRSRSPGSDSSHLATPAPRCTSLDSNWPSGRAQLRSACSKTRWPDGARVGRGFPQPYLQAQYAVAVANGRKTVEGRPGGGWLAQGKGIKPDDYIRFKIPGRPGCALVVSYSSFASSERHAPATVADQHSNSGPRALLQPQKRASLRLCTLTTLYHSASA